jgi:uncharacterized protein YebE (UPF0316 family)
MSIDTVLTFLLIVLARIGDVSLDAVRTVAIVQGRRLFAAILGFVQATVYVCVIAKVLEGAQQPALMLAYGIGFALGTYFGIVLDQRIAFGQQTVSLFTRKGPEVADALRAAGHRVVQVVGRGHDGEVGILFVEVPRRRAQAVLHAAGVVDQTCFCIVNDVRVADLAAGTPARRRPRVAGHRGERASPPAAGASGSTRRAR